MSFHILYCEVEAASDVDIAQVKENSHSHLLASRRRACRKAWISSLLKQDGEQG